MESAFDSIGKSFTRYFMPGLIFVIFSIFVPSLFFIDFNSLQSEFKINISAIIVASLVFGYLLDSAGAYRWTLHFSRYKGERVLLSRSLSYTSGQTYDDPDSHISKLWIGHERLYERIFIERAEWVLILESAFALLFGSVASIVVGCFQYLTKNEFHLSSPTIALAGIAASYLISEKGIQRMIAHNKKLVEAIRVVYDVDNRDLERTVAESDHDPA